MTAHNRKLKQIIFNLGGTEYQAQVQSWTMKNDTNDAEVFYVYEPGEEFAEEAEPQWSLDVTFYADWRSDGISDFLMAHDEEDVAFTLEHHPDIPAEHVTWTGSLHIKAPNVGGDVRSTETTEVTFQCIGKPVYSHA